MAMLMLMQRLGKRLGDEGRRYTFSTTCSSSSSSMNGAGAAAAAAAPVLCGRGDKRTKKGKIFKGSYGNSRPKKDKYIQRIKDKLEVPRSTPWPLPFKLI